MVRYQMISIIIPVYNVEKYLERCVNSILTQSYKDFELILVDDGSSDRSGEICDSFSYDTRVKIIHQKNMGVSSARNAGMNIMQGDYVWFIDADDWIDENALSIIMQKGKQSDLIFFGALAAIKNNEGVYTYQKRVYWDNRENTSLVDNVYIEVFEKNVTLWSKVIKREIIQDVRFNTSMTYGEDCDFLCRILENVKSAIIIPKELYYYFVNRTGNVVSAKLDRRSLEFLDNTRLIYDMLAVQNNSSSAIIRIFTVVNEILSKIPSTLEGIKEYKIYVRETRKLMFYPKWKDLISFFLNSRIDKRVRLSYFRIMINPFYMYSNLLKNRIKGLF